jgi:uncharacterized LabA/DUF88 family protein
MRKLNCQRIAVLVDADNLEIFARDAFARVIDYRALWCAMNGREVVRAIYFKPRECPPRLRTFLEQGLGMEVKIPPENVDTYLAMAAVSLAERVDTIALCGGDSDYVPLLEYLRSKGCKTEVWSFPGTTSAALRAAADEFRALDESILLPAFPKSATAVVSPLLRKVAPVSRGLQAELPEEAQV